MSIEIRPIPLRPKEVKAFILFAWEIYKDRPHWVPPLIMDQLGILSLKKNPFFEHSEAHLFGAYENGKMVGRIAVGVNNNSNKFRNENVAFFGFFESVDRQDVADALFKKATSWAKQNGLSKLRGPFNLTINDETGMLVDGFDKDPYIMMTYNPEYYPTLLEKAGFQKAMDAFAFFSDNKKVLTDALLQMSDHVEKTLKPTLRPIDTGKGFINDCHIAMDMVNESLAENWGASPLTKKEIEFMGNNFKPVVKPDLCFFVEVNGKPVGFSLTLPNFNEAIKKANGRLFPFGLIKMLWHMRKVKTVRVLQLGMIKEYQKSGLGAYCYVQIAKAATKRGLSSGEMSWILENNKPMVNGAALMGGEKYKTYRWYEKEV